MFLGQYMLHTISGEAGIVDAVSSHPDGETLSRINDKWFFDKDLTFTIFR